jgi:hypothetical protein
MLLAATFALRVTGGSQPIYERGEYPSYSRCVEAAQGEVESLGDDVRWDCVLERRE